MAGHSRRAAVLAELERRTRDTFGEADDDSADTPAPTPLDYVCHWLENAGTLKALAAEIEAKLHVEVSPSFLQRCLWARHGEGETDSAISQARVRASHMYAEDALAIVDEPADTQVEVSRAASRARSRQWLAEKYNPRAFGASKEANVTINIGSMHLAALQAQRGNLPTCQVTTTDEVRGLLPSSVTVTEDAQVVE